MGRLTAPHFSSLSDAAFTAELWVKILPKEVCNIFPNRVVVFGVILETREIGNKYVSWEGHCLLRKPIHLLCRAPESILGGGSSVYI